MNEIDRISRSFDAAVNLMTQTIELYEQHRQGKSIQPTDVQKILRQLSSDKEDLKWAIDKVAEVKKNPLKLDFIRVSSEAHSTKMAVNLLNAMGQTSPGKPFPSAESMVHTLGIEKKENVELFKEGYNDTVRKIEKSHLSAQDKTSNFWFWMCMSMFGTLGLLVAFWIARKFYEMFMEWRENVAKFFMPKGPLTKFSLFSFIKKNRKKRAPYRLEVVPTMGDDDT
jgi:hypothetical protein